MIIRDPRLRHSASGAVITVPLFLVIHRRKLQRDHNLAFNIMTEIIPELSSSFFIAISDDKFTEVLAKHFKRAFTAVDKWEEWVNRAPPLPTFLSQLQLLGTTGSVKEGKIISNF